MKETAVHEVPARTEGARTEPSIISDYVILEAIPYSGDEVASVIYKEPMDEFWAEGMAI